MFLKSLKNHLYKADPGRLLTLYHFTLVVTILDLLQVAALSGLVIQVNRFLEIGQQSVLCKLRVVLPGGVVVVQPQRVDVRRAASISAWERDVTHFLVCLGETGYIYHSGGVDLFSKA